MALAERFEDLVAWQKARALRSHVYVVTRRLAFQQDLDLKRQMRRAAVSIELNIAEGFERASKPDFAHFLVMARGSCGEVRAQAWVAMDEGYIDQGEFDLVRREAEEVARILAGLRSSLIPADGSNRRGG